MTAYKFATIDPRSFALSDELERLAQMGKTLGAEVTVPAVAGSPHRGEHRPSAHWR